MRVIKGAAVRTWINEMLGALLQPYEDEELERIATTPDFTRIACRPECGQWLVDRYNPTCAACGGETDEELRTRIKESLPQ